MLQNMKRTIPKTNYDIVLSFAGEDRGFVEEVAECLQLFGVRVFYDRWEEHKLLGEDLYTYLGDIYENRASYCAMFISQHYVSKAWPSHERKFAQARAFQSTEPYILPVRLDDTQCPGVPKTIGFIDANKKGPIEVAVTILRKLGHNLINCSSDQVMLKRYVRWQIFWNRSIAVLGDFSAIWVEREPKHRICFNVWSPDDRPLEIADVSVVVGRKRLQTSVSSAVQNAKQCNARLPRPIEFGRKLDYKVRYRCPQYYENLLELCKDDFMASWPMLRWEYDFVFPKNSILKVFRMFHTYDGNRCVQAYDTSIEHGCPVVHFCYAMPNVGMKLEIEFKLGRA